MQPGNELQAGRNVLLTGASGYLGGHILQELVGRGWAVRALLRAGSTDFRKKAEWIEEQGAQVVEGDLRSTRALRHVCRDVEAVVHSAAVLGNWSRQNTHQYHVNVDGTASLMRVALERGVQRVIHVSSIAAIGATRDPRAMNEDEVWSWSHRPKLHYSKTKREAEERCLHALRNGLPVVVVNPTAILGCAAQAEQLRGLCVSAREGRPSRLINGGASFACVEDVARSVVVAIEKGRVGERYILGGANGTWRDFYEASASFHGQDRRYGTWPNALGRVLDGGATLIDGVGLSRPPWAPERYRIWGWYGFADSTKAERELGHVVRTLPEVLRRVHQNEGAGSAADPSVND
jgi:dihydroflavonol-4-reductase